jgi:hypothetical protein
MYGLAESKFLDGLAQFKLLGQFTNPSLFLVGAGGERGTVFSRIFLRHFAIAGNGAGVPGARNL